MDLSSNTSLHWLQTAPSDQQPALCHPPSSILRLNLQKRHRPCQERGVTWDEKIQHYHRTLIKKEGKICCTQTLGSFFPARGSKPTLAVWTCNCWVRTCFLLPAVKRKNTGTFSKRKILFGLYNLIKVQVCQVVIISECFLIFVCQIWTTCLIYEAYQIDQFKVSPQEMHYQRYWI